MNDKYGQFYSIQDVANLLCLDVQTIRRFIKRGKLEACRFGKKLLVAETAIERFIEQNKVLVAAAATVEDAKLESMGVGLV